jgi:hypothetical protein
VTKLMAKIVKCRIKPSHPTADLFFPLSLFTTDRRKSFIAMWCSRPNSVTFKSHSQMSFHTEALHSLSYRFIRTASREPRYCHGEPIYSRISFWKRSQSSRRTLSSESHETAGTRSCHPDDFTTAFSQFLRLCTMRYGSIGYHEGTLFFVVS